MQYELRLPQNSSETTFGESGTFSSSSSLERFEKWRYPSYKYASIVVSEREKQEYNTYTVMNLKVPKNIPK